MWIARSSTPGRSRRRRWVRGGLPTPPTSTSARSGAARPWRAGTPAPTVSWPWCTSWGEGETTMEASCPSTSRGARWPPAGRPAEVRVEIEVERRVQEDGNETGPPDAPSASARRRSRCPSKPRLATTLTTVQPRSSRWRSAPGQPTASSSGWGATWRMVGATSREVTPVGSGRRPNRSTRSDYTARALFTDYSESNILTECPDGPAPTPWPWRCWSACTRSRCTPTRWPRRCASGPSRRASASTTARSTPWSTRWRSGASSRPPARCGRGSGPSGPSTRSPTRVPGR